VKDIWSHSFEEKEKKSLFDDNAALSFKKEDKGNNKSNANEDHKFESRLYPATLMACSQEKVDGAMGLSPDHLEQRFKLLFMQVFVYLNGENSQKEKRPMTAPVFSLVHLNEEFLTDRIAMCFWLTQDTEGLVAEPLVGSPVSLWRMEPATFYVRRFSGPGGEEQRDVWQKEAETLTKGLATMGLLEKTDKRLIIFSTYQAPWQQADRRDEILLRVALDSEIWQTPFHGDEGHSHGKGKE